jgi:hypothetical protein
LYSYLNLDFCLDRKVVVVENRKKRKRHLYRLAFAYFLTHFCLLPKDVAVDPSSSLRVAIALSSQKKLRKITKAAEPQVKKSQTHETRAQTIKNEAEKRYSTKRVRSIVRAPHPPTPAFSLRSHSCSIQQVGRCCDFLVISEWGG